MTGTKEMGVRAWIDVGDERMNQEAKWGRRG